MSAIAALAVACTTQSAGHPVFAGVPSSPDLPTGGGIDAPSSSASGESDPLNSASASASASTSASASDSAGPSASAGSGGNEPSPQQVAEQICSAASADQLRRIFGGAVDAQPSIAFQCTFTGNGTKVLVYEFAHVTLTEAAAEASNPQHTTIAGHPAAVDGRTVTVSEGQDADDPGIVRGITDSGNASITRALLEAIVPRFAGN